MKWLLDNANWIFSGVGIVLFTGIGYLIKPLFNRDNQGQSQITDHNSVAVQAGRDVKIGRGSDQGSQ